MIICRVATDRFSVMSHLAYNLNSFPHSDFVHVVGNNVEGLAEHFPHVVFHNIDIRRDISVFSDLKALINLVLLFYKIRPDVVHSIMPKSGLLCAAASFIARGPVRLHTFRELIQNALPIVLPSQSSLQAMV